jgi:hypothetical protein
MTKNCPQPNTGIGSGKTPTEGGKYEGWKGRPDGCAGVLQPLAHEGAEGTYTGRSGGDEDAPPDRSGRRTLDPAFLHPRQLVIFNRPWGMT